MHIVGLSLFFLLAGATPGTQKTGALRFFGRRQSPLGHPADRSQTPGPLASTAPGRPGPLFQLPHFLNSGVDWGLGLSFCALLEALAAWRNWAEAATEAAHRSRRSAWSSVATPSVPERLGVLVFFF